MALPKPALGPAIYRAMDGITDLACIVTLVDIRDGCSLTVFAPGRAPEFYTRIKWERENFASPQPGTCRPVGT